MLGKRDYLLSSSCLDIVGCLCDRGLLQTKRQRLVWRRNEGKPSCCYGFFYWGA